MSSGFERARAGGPKVQFTGQSVLERSRGAPIDSESVLIARKTTLRSPVSRVEVNHRDLYHSPVPQTLHWKYVVIPIMVNSAAYEDMPSHR